MTNQEPLIIFKLHDVPLQGEAWVDCPACKVPWSLGIRVQDEPDGHGGTETSCYVMEQMCKCKLTPEQLQVAGGEADRSLRNRPGSAWIKVGE